MTLDERYRQLARTLGSDWYGVANLAPAHEAIVAQGGALAGTFPRAISVGVRLMDAIVDELPQADDIVVVSNYRHHAYDVVNRRLDELVSRLASTVQTDGYRAWPVPTTGVLFPDRLCAFFSHKMAAHLAGLAWIGKSCLAVTPEAGPRVRWGTLLTDAPLAPGKPLDERCGSCRQCVDICPAQAFTGRAFHAEEARITRYDAHACNAYQQHRAEETGLPILCGLCLYVCPHGRQGS